MPLNRNLFFGLSEAGVATDGNEISGAEEEGQRPMGSDADGLRAEH